MYPRSTRPFLALLVLCTACAERDRPFPLEAVGPVSLNVELLSPRLNETVFAGRVLGVHVQATEPGGRLHGLGYVARRSGGSTLDSAVIRFGGRSDSAHVFVLEVPADLPTNAQIDIFGLAFGPQTERMISVPRAVIVLKCSPGAVWCS